MRARARARAHTSERASLHCPWFAGWSSTASSTSTTPTSTATMLARTDSVIPTYTEGGRLFLSFADARLEARYQTWYSRNYRKSLHMRLLVATFLYFLLAVAFTAWAHINSHSVTAWPHLMTVSDTVMGLVLSMSFALSFCQCAARRPQVFSSIVLLVTIAFVVLRSTLLDIAAVYSAPVLLVLIVCLLLGSTLLRMPCGSTLFVGLVTCAIWGAVALLELRRAPDGSAWEPVALFLVVGAATLAAGQLERLQRHLFLMQFTRSHDSSSALRGRSTSTRGNTREDLRPHASSDCSQPGGCGGASDMDRLSVNLAIGPRDGSRTAAAELAGYMCPSPPLYGMGSSPCMNSELLGPLLAGAGGAGGGGGGGGGPGGMPSPVSAHVARGGGCLQGGGDSASVSGVGEVFSSLPHRHSPTTSSAPSGLLDAALAARDGLQVASCPTHSAPPTHSLSLSLSTSPLPTSPLLASPLHLSSSPLLFTSPLHLSSPPLPSTSPLHPSSPRLSPGRRRAPRRSTGCATRCASC